MSKLVEVIPAAFSNSPDEKVSEKYNFISSEQIMATFQENNWLPASVSQVMSRDSDKKVFAKHLVRFRNPDIKNDINGLFPEIVMVNSHNRSSTFQLMAGLFRMACANGMIIADSTFETIKTRHSRLAPEIIEVGIKDIVEIVPQIMNKVDEMMSFEMKAKEKEKFAENVIEMVWKDSEVKPLEPVQLIETRRSEDRKDNLWTTYNTVQENLIKGGLIGTNAANKKRKMRAITNIDKDVKINKLLWEEADKMLAA